MVAFVRVSQGGITVQEQLGQASEIYDLVVTFLVNYSFQILGAILILVVGIFIAGKISNWLFAFCQSKNLDITLSRFIASVVKLLFILMIGIIALGNIGISVTPFVAAIGALSLGAGLALQGLLSNYGAGLNIIVTRPFVVGDTIHVQGVTGVVSEVSLATTILIDEDDVRITIPNKHIVGEIIHNSGSVSLVEIDFKVAPDADIPQLLETALATVHATEGLDSETSALFGVNKLSGEGLEISGRVWVPTKKYFHYKYAILKGLHRQLQETGVPLVVPVQEVRLQQD